MVCIFGILLRKASILFALDCGRIMSSPLFCRSLPRGKATFKPFALKLGTRLVPFATNELSYEHSQDDARYCHKLT
jgi:hypothetical protein